MFKVSVFAIAVTVCGTCFADENEAIKCQTEFRQSPEGSLLIGKAGSPYGDDKSNFDAMSRAALPTPVERKALVAAGNKLVECSELHLALLKATTPSALFSVAEGHIKKQHVNLATFAAGGVTWGQYYNTKQATADEYRATFNAAFAEMKRLEGLREDYARAAAESERQERALDIQRAELARRQEQVDRQNQFINGLRMLEAAQPRPMPSTGMNCQSYRALNGNVITNCR